MALYHSAGQAGPSGQRCGVIGGGAGAGWCCLTREQKGPPLGAGRGEARCCPGSKQTDSSHHVESSRVDATQLDLAAHSSGGHAARRSRRACNAGHALGSRASPRSGRAMATQQRPGVRAQAPPPQSPCTHRQAVWRGPEQRCNLENTLALRPFHFPQSLHRFPSLRQLLAPAPPCVHPPPIAALCAIPAAKRPQAPPRLCPQPAFGPSCHATAQLADLADLACTKPKTPQVRIPARRCCVLRGHALPRPAPQPLAAPPPSPLAQCNRARAGFSLQSVRPLALGKGSGQLDSFNPSAPAFPLSSTAISLGLTRLPAATVVTRCVRPTLQTRKRKSPHKHPAASS